jgi:predicted nucleic acid-binding protein
VSDAEKVLKTLNVVRVSRANLQLAARLKPTKLRTLDAIHLSTALDLAEESLYFVSYDKLLLEAAKINGLQTLTPS